MYYIEVLTKFSERPSTPSKYTELPTTTVSSEEAKGIIYNPTVNQVKVNLEEVWYAQENHMKKQPSPSSLEDLTTENEQLVDYKGIIIVNVLIPLGNLLKWRNVTKASKLL